MSGQTQTDRQTDAQVPCIHRDSGACISIRGQTNSAKAALNVTEIPILFVRQNSFLTFPLPVFIVWGLQPHLLWCALGLSGLRLRCAKTTERIEVLLGVETVGEPRHIASDGVRIFVWCGAVS